MSRFTWCHLVLIVLIAGMLFGAGLGKLAQRIPFPFPDSLSHGGKQVTNRRRYVISLTICAAFAIAILATAFEKLALDLAWLWVTAMAVMVGAVIGVVAAEIQFGKRNDIPKWEDEWVDEHVARGVAELEAMVLPEAKR